MARARKPRYAAAMRIAVLSDIHSNRVALAAVLAAIDEVQPDRVVVAGDTINRGPKPHECLTTILERRDRLGWHVLKGNHEDYVLLVDRQTAEERTYLRELLRHTQWTCNKTRDLIPALAQMPDHLSLSGPDGSEVRFLHASIHGNRSGIYEDMEEDVVASMVYPQSAVTVVGHTHVAFVRRVGSSLVVNAGAAGLPFDGDTRAAFAVLEWSDGKWCARIHRVAYDLAAAEQDFHDSGYLRDGGPMTPLILHELRRARPMLGVWHRHYEPLVARGELSLSDSIADLLKTRGDYQGWA